MFQYFAAHSPDNSFIGFVSGAAHQTKKKNKNFPKKNMALVYAKQDSYWIVSYMHTPKILNYFQY
jgi:hypothetical protein